MQHNDCIVYMEYILQLVNDGHVPTTSNIL